MEEMRKEILAGVPQAQRSSQREEEAFADKRQGFGTKMLRTIALASAIGTQLSCGIPPEDQQKIDQKEGVFPLADLAILATGKVGDQVYLKISFRAEAEKVPFIVQSSIKDGTGKVEQLPPQAIVKAGPQEFTMKVTPKGDEFAFILNVQGKSKEIKVTVPGAKDQSEIDRARQES